MAPSSQRRAEKEAETERRRRFAMAAWEQRQCAVTLDMRDYRPGPVGKNWEAHHVVEKRWLRRFNFPPRFIWDERNALRLRPDVHEKHTNRSDIVPIQCLLACNIEFAFEVMGPAAEDYLERMYRNGPDARVQRALEVATEKMEAEIDALPPGTLWVPPHLRNDKQ